MMLRGIVAAQLSIVSSPQNRHTSPATLARPPQASALWRHAAQFGSPARQLTPTGQQETVPMPPDSFKQLVHS
jgi:hypothetical protein